MKDWRYIIREQRGTLIAMALFVAMFAIYVTNHPAGFNADVVTTAANEGVLLALVAIAQTFVVLTAGIDRSVGMIFVPSRGGVSHHPDEYAEPEQLDKGVAVLAGTLDRLAG